MEEKLKALLDGLECKHINQLINKATPDDFRLFGKAYIEQIHSLKKRI